MGALDQPLRKPVEFMNLRTRKVMKFSRAHMLREVAHAYLPDRLVALRINSTDAAFGIGMEKFDVAEKDVARLMDLIDRRESGERLLGEDATFIANMHDALDKLISGEQRGLARFQREGLDLEETTKKHIIMEETPGFLADHKAPEDLWAIDSRKAEIELTDEDLEATQVSIVKGKISKQNMVTFLETLRSVVSGQPLPPKPL